MRVARVLPIVLATLAAYASSRAEEPWSFSASAYTYFVPDDRDYLQPTFTADLDTLHLEARLNYEAFEAVSVWVGRNFSGGESLTWEATPMVAGVFGEAVGVALGYKATLGWSMLELYSEGEYLFDLGESADSFFCNWSELAVVPRDWFRAGLVTQRTRAYASDREIQRGPFVGFSFGRVYAAGYLFLADAGDPTGVVALAVEF